MRAILACKKRIHMKIADKTVVQMHYTLTSDEGKVIDSSEGREPLQYIQGAHMIVVGLEKAMVGHEVGDKFDVKVIPAEGYGEYDERMTRKFRWTFSRMSRMSKPA